MTKALTDILRGHVLWRFFWLLVAITLASCSSRRLREERIFQALEREEQVLPRTHFAVGATCYRLELPKGRTFPRLLQEGCDGSNPRLLIDLALLLPGELRSVRGIRVSPDGSRLAVLAGTTGGSELIIAELSEKRPNKPVQQPLYRTAAPFEFEWLADSARLALIRRDQSGGSKFTVLNYRAGLETPIAELAGGAEYLHLELTASGRYLLLAHRSLFSDRWQAYSAGSIESAPLQVSAGDGKALACDTVEEWIVAEDSSDGETQVRILKIADGKERRLKLPINLQLERISCFSGAALLTLQDGWGQRVYYLDAEAAELTELALPYLWNKVPPSQRYESQLARVSSEGPGQPAQNFIVDLSAGRVSVDGAVVPARRELEIRKELIRSVGDVLIPVTIITPANRHSTRAEPILLHTYGAYGVSVPTDYDPALLPLWDYGFGYAVANVPGGGGHGVAWHKLAAGRNKLSGVDHIKSVATALKNRSEIGSTLIFGYGRSAGALLLLSAATKTRGLFEGVILDAPILRSPVQLGSSEPLYARELLEWGEDIEPFDMLTLSQGLRPPNFFLSFSERDDTISVPDILRWLSAQRELHAEEIEMVVHPMSSSTHHGADFREEEFRLRAKQIEFMLGLSHR